MRPLALAFLCAPGLILGADSPGKRETQEAKASLARALEETRSTTSVVDGASRPCEVLALDGAYMRFVDCAPQAAFELAERHAMNEDGFALFALARVYEFGGEEFGLTGKAQDSARALDYMRRAAVAGYGEAQAMLARMVRAGNSPDAEREAIVWYCRAARQGVYSAIVTLGNLGESQRRGWTWKEFCREREPQPEGAP